jgi:hypothetical protein
MSKLIKISIIILLVFGANVAFAKLRRIPSPNITSQEKFIAAGTQFQIEGQGFIKDFTKANRAYLKKKKGKKGKNKRIKLKTISSSETSISLESPENIPYGDYDLYIFLKTRFFKSKIKRLKNFLHIRPQAPLKPELSFFVIKNPNELSELIEDENLVLHFDEELKVGINSARAFYYEEGYKSLLSEVIDIYYLKEDEFEPRLTINSEKPLSSYARMKDKEDIEVSDITVKAEHALTRRYHLVTPSDANYLATEIQLSPIYIKEAHVKTPEYLILQNRSNQDFDLTNCEIHDAISKRHSFQVGNSMPAKSQFRVEEKLSLNDSGDTIQIICSEQVIDEVEYTKTTADGFAILD